MKEYKPEGLCRLPEEESYQRYFSEVERSFALLLALRRFQISETDEEVWTTDRYLQRMLETIRSLRWKYRKSDISSLQVDVTDSGFPSYMEIDNLTFDLERRDEALKDIPPREELLAKALDKLLGEGVDPIGIITRLRERKFFESLSDTSLFFTFVPGELQRVPSESKKWRSYLYHWGCYDFIKNRPNIHFMAFDQESGDEPFDRKGANWKDFLKTIRTEGSRVPDIGVLGTQIDTGTVGIRPKLIKRICIGPFYSADITQDNAPIQHLLSEESGDSFAICWKVETLVSKGIEEMGNFFNRSYREVFLIPENDPELIEARASNLERGMILPHRTLQAIRSDRTIDAEYRKYMKYTYDKKGHIYES